MRLGLYAAMLVLALSGSAAADTLDKIKEKGFLVIGHRATSAPFSFVNDAGQPAGYSIELCKRIATAVRNHLGMTDLEIVYQEVSAEDRIDKLAEGEVDIVCGSTTNTLARQERVAFSLLTFVTGAGLVVAADSGIASLKDVAGGSVAVLGGTTTETVLLQRLKADFIDAEVVLVGDHQEGMAAVEAGGVNAFMTDRVLLVSLLKQAKDPAKLTVLKQYFSYEPYALMMRRGDDDLRLLVDRTLASLYRSGGITEIYESWFADFGKPSDLLRALYILQALPER